MFTHITPKFEKGRILKTAMLESLRDFPHQFAQISYQDYADGVITGAEIQVEAHSLTIAPGILKHQGRVYLMNQPVSLPYQASGRETAVKVKFREGTENSDWIRYETEIALGEPADGRFSELELCRFKLKEGARLRQDYQNFRDLATEYNTVNLLHVRFAASGQSTLSPVILRFFASEMLQSGAGDPRDYLFAMMCLNEGTVSREVIQHYIASRSGIAYKEYTNPELHKYLARILDTVRSGGGRTYAGAGGSQRMIVD